MGKVQNHAILTSHFELGHLWAAGATQGLERIALSLPKAVQPKLELSSGSQWLYRGGRSRLVQMRHTRDLAIAKLSVKPLSYCTNCNLAHLASDPHRPAVEAGV